MFAKRWLKPLAPVLLCLVLLVASCGSAPSKYDQVQEDTTGRRAPAAVDKQAEKGGTFNQFFPAAEGDYTIVPSQEKQGFAEYKLKQNGTTLAMLTINDTTSVPAAAAKYENATETIAGYPAVNQGTTATGILVNNRYQVKVLSRDPSFTQEDRVIWLQKFDLAGLATLEGALRPTSTKSAAKPKQAPGAKPESTSTAEPEPAPAGPGSSPDDACS
jgi:3D (Asp-Asp-Asp) domain-containing protein